MKRVKSYVLPRYEYSRDRMVRSWTLRIRRRGRWRIELSIDRFHERPD